MVSGHTVRAPGVGRVRVCGVGVSGGVCVGVGGVWGACGLGGGPLLVKLVVEVFGRVVRVVHTWLRGRVVLAGAVARPAAAVRRALAIPAHVSRRHWPPHRIPRLVSIGSPT
ncbi:unnamed protein product, partial [Brenthis ino]